MSHKTEIPRRCQFTQRLALIAFIWERIILNSVSTNIILTKKTLVYDFIDIQMVFKGYLEIQLLFKFNVKYFEKLALKFLLAEPSILINVVFSII